MSTFRTAGDLGDIIYGLPAVRFLGGGTIFWHAAKWTRQRMTEALWANIAPLLEAQEYITGTAPWKGERVDHNLNDFRAAYFSAIHKAGGKLIEPRFPIRRSIAEWICRQHGAPMDELAKPWLKVEPVRVAEVIINRTDRYQNQAFPWRAILEASRGRHLFLGTETEAARFRKETGDPNVPWLSTPTLLKAAQVIAGADLFIGNQSACYAIAEGLKKNAMLEVCPWLPNCLFHRGNCWHGWDANIANDLKTCLRSQTSP
jgi:hypothetical protein